jgi:hypothetical protein
MAKMPDAVREIHSATTPETVTEIVRGFLRELSEAEHGDLPWGLTHDVVLSPTDIALWALELQRKGLATSGNPTFGRISRVFGEAARRLADLGAVSEQPF